MAAAGYRTATKTITFPSYNNGEVPFAFAFHDTSTYHNKSFGEYFTVSVNAPAGYASPSQMPGMAPDCYVTLSSVSATSATFSLCIYTAVASPDFSKFKAGPLYSSMLTE